MSKRREADQAGVPGKGHCRPQSDEERVLGQIANGDVRVGPDAAREIAAKQEAAYGSAFRKK